MFILAQLGYWPIHFTISVGLMAILSAVVFVVVSFRTPPPDPEQVELTTWKPALARPERPMPWYKDYRVHSIVVGLGMLAVLIGFW